jgi:hypothetical protein
VRFFVRRFIGAGQGLGAGLTASHPPLVQPDSTLPAFGANDAGFGATLNKENSCSAQSVSGIACALNAKQQRMCLLALTKAPTPTARLDGNTLKPLKSPSR